jgi:hypothetical protein
MSILLRIFASWMNSKKAIRVASGLFALPMYSRQPGVENRIGESREERAPLVAGLGGFMAS